MIARQANMWDTKGLKKSRKCSNQKANAQKEIKFKKYIIYQLVPLFGHLVFELSISFIPFNTPRANHVLAHDTYVAH